MRNLRTSVLTAASFAAVFLLINAVGPAAEPLDSARGEQAKPAAPTFKVDPAWPQEMPNHWIMGAVTAVFVDAKQHVWVAHLPETLTEEELYEEPWKVGAGVEAGKPKPAQLGSCCKAAPPILEFDPQGNWSGGGQDRYRLLPTGRAIRHGLVVDHQDNVPGSAATRHRVMKFTRRANCCCRSASTKRWAAGRHQAARRTVGHLGRSQNQRIFISDGYAIAQSSSTAPRRIQAPLGRVRKPCRRHREVSIRDEMIGALPSILDAARHTGSKDGKIYVTDAAEPHPGVRSKANSGGESESARYAVVRDRHSCRCCPRHVAATVALRRRRHQPQVWILARSDLEIVGEFGSRGRQLGQNLRPHGMAADSQGNSRRRGLNRPRVQSSRCRA